MKPREPKPAIVFRVFDRRDGSLRGAYSRAYCTEFDFGSADEARTSNVHGMFENRDKYKVAKYKVTYELLEDDCQ